MSSINNTEVVHKDEHREGTDIQVRMATSTAQEYLLKVGMTTDANHPENRTYGTDLKQNNQVFRIDVGISADEPPFTMMNTEAWGLLDSSHPELAAAISDSLEEVLKGGFTAEEQKKLYEAQNALREALVVVADGAGNITDMQLDEIKLPKAIQSFNDLKHVAAKDPARSR